MTAIATSPKAVAVNPLKLSQPLGAALAFLGIKGAIPLLHGSQGCTAFAKVLLVRHFREAIPLSTTALTEVATILGGEENLAKSIAVLAEKVQPELIGLCTTALAETRGEDVEGMLRRLPQPVPVVFASTPDFRGSLQDGYAAAVAAIAQTLPVAGERLPQQVTVLLGSHCTPGDAATLKETIADFGLTPIVVPDLSTSLDGHLGDDYQAVSTGGTPLDQLRAMGRSAFVLAIGESMRPAAESLHQRFQVPFVLLEGATGLAAVDLLLLQLSQWSGQAVPEKYRWQRRQLLDAMLDTHFYFGRKRVALGLEPDLLSVISHFLVSMGAQVQAAVTTAKSPLLADLPVATVTIGDLADLERQAAGADLLVTNSRGSAIARKLEIPLFRLGFPIFDRLGNGLRTYVGYRGTTQLLFDIGNLFIDAETTGSGHPP